MALPGIAGEPPCRRWRTAREPRRPPPSGWLGSVGIRFIRASGAVGWNMGRPGATWDGSPWRCDVPRCPAIFCQRSRQVSLSCRCCPRPTASPSSPPPSNHGARARYAASSPTGLIAATRAPWPTCPGRGAPLPSRYGRGASAVRPSAARARFSPSAGPRSRDLGASDCALGRHPASHRLRAGLGAWIAPGRPALDAGERRHAAAPGPCCRAGAAALATCGRHRRLGVAAASATGSSSATSSAAG